MVAIMHPFRYFMEGVKMKPSGRKICTVSNIKIVLQKVRFIKLPVSGFTILFYTSPPPPPDCLTTTTTTTTTHSGMVYYGHIHL